MGKHSQKNSLGLPGEHARRVPLERRRSPGEHNTAEQTHADETYRLSDPKSRRRGSLEAAPARLRVERDRRRSRVKTFMFALLGGILVLLVLAVVGAYAYAKHIESTMQRTVVSKQKLDAALTKAKAMEPFNVLVLGADYRPGDTAYRTDSIIVAHVDPKAKRVWLLSIPRDTRVELPGQGAHKITEAHVFGGAEGSIAAVEKLTGLKMNHYLELNFQGFRDAVNALGGVWVNVPVTINDTEADQTPHNTASHIDAGYQLLDGNHALTFVRARHQFADQDFTRMKDQQLFFRALADQVAKVDNITKLPGVVSAVAPYIATDMSLIDMIQLAQALKGAGSANMYTATLMGTWQSPFIYVDQSSLTKLVGDIKDEIPFVKVKKSDTATGTVTASKKPSQITLAVHNGAGVAGVAKQAASILKAKGFKIHDVGNANQNVYKQTFVIFKTDATAATLVSSFLPPGARIVQSRGMYAFTGDVLVIVGKDWDVSKVPAAPVVTQ
jgi:polyisoprenyl-teichoic acid--peptidoglycan teichoic acid transferase